MILHIVKRGEWEDAVGRGSYAPASLRDEGFIHCSTSAQVIDTGNRFYRGQRDLIVLWIEETRVKAEVRWEAPAEVRNLTPDPFPRGKGNQKKRLKRRGPIPHAPFPSASGKGDRIDDQLFPHLYGELNVDAVVRVIELPCEEDGSFRMPKEIQI